MRAMLAAICIGLVSILGYLAGAIEEKDAGVRLRLIDEASGKPLGGMIRIRPAGRDQPLVLSGLLDRMRGILEKSEGRTSWYVVPAGGATTKLPRAKLTLEAIHGLESATARQDLDLTVAAPEELVVKLPMLFRPETQGLAAGNTHLHLMKLTRSEADEYLRHLPPADGLKVMFLSYLERNPDDRDYITNRYPIGDLQFAGSPTLYSNGEEHRHNFEGYGQGYGHVMLLGIKQLVRPVSIGPGIMRMGNDDRPLRPGIDEARAQGGTIVWCHNTYGHEDVPNMLAGRLDALNVFDGSRRDAYEDTYYRFLNIGLQVPISTGTDWFLYDFARVYARTGNAKLTIPAWLEALKKGRSVATNGPLLSLTVDGKQLGDVINLDEPRAVRVEASAVGRHDFAKLQLIRNGEVVDTASARADEGGFRATIARSVPINGPSWFAVRVDATAANEFGLKVFAHSSPVYVNVAGRGTFDLDSARALLRLVEEGRADVRARGKFSTDAARDKLLTLYDQAAADLRERINKRGK